jgi:hypothetical protein
MHTDFAERGARLNVMSRMSIGNNLEKLSCQSMFFIQHPQP